MKYKILLPFILVVMLAGCTGKHSNGDQTSITKIDSTDTLTVNDTMTRHDGLFDSIRDPSLREMVMHDSIEMLGVKHFNAGSIPGEEILYLDYRIPKNYGEIERLNSRSRQGEIKMLNFTETLAHINNPFPEMNGTYTEIKKYRGSFVTLSMMDETVETPTISDTNIFISRMMSVNCPYISATRKDGNIITYKIMEGQKPISIDIKMLGGKYKTQLWKGFGNNMYELMVLDEKVIGMPVLVYTNNVGLAAGSGFDIKFDSIN